VKTAQEVTGFAFSIGEEVVARLERADVFDTERGIQMPQDYRPSWTIGSVIECISEQGRRAYVLRFSLCGDTYVCVVTEDFIEGVA
jgi:hypothetical protein